MPLGDGLGGEVACASTFFAFDFATFEGAFPGMRSCSFSAFAHVADEVLRLSPQRCRAPTAAAADFIFPPAYLHHEHNWPFYCKAPDRELNAGGRNDRSGTIDLSSLVTESADVSAPDWEIAAADVQPQTYTRKGDGNVPGKSKDHVCSARANSRSWNGSNSCTHVAMWRTRYATPPAVRDMLTNATTWRAAFGVDLRRAKLVVLAHGETPLKNMGEWEEYPFETDLYTAPHVVWAKLSSRSWYTLGKDTKSRGVYRAGIDIALPPPAQRAAHMLAERPLRPLASKPYLIGFQGNLGFPTDHVRTRMRGLHNGDDVQIRATRSGTSNAFADYAEFMDNTTFALNLRGDTKWTHRMIDTICAGGIPVLLTDFLVPPFEDTLPWDSFGVVINESRWTETEAILRAIPLDQRQRLQLAARSACQRVFMTVPLQLQHVLETVVARGADRSEMPTEASAALPTGHTTTGRTGPTVLSRAPTASCASSHRLWCSACACEARDRPLKAMPPDTGMGNRMAMLMSFAAIGASLGRRVLTFWPTIGNTNYKKHSGRRFYGHYEEFRDLVVMPRVLHFLDEGQDAQDEVSNSTLSGTRFRDIPLHKADEIPNAWLPRGLQLGWGNPAATWYYWHYWAQEDLWPRPCADRAAFMAHFRSVLGQVRPRVDLRNPEPRSYSVLHLRRGDRGTTGFLASKDPLSLNLTWQNVHAVARRSRLPWLVISDNQSARLEAEELLRAQYGDRAVLARAELDGEEEASLLRKVLRDFFAMAASAGVVFSGLRMGPWVDSSFSTMAALVGDAPLLLPTTTDDGGFTSRFQRLANESGEPLHSYFFADQTDEFVQELARCRTRPFPLHVPKGPPANSSCEADIIDDVYTRADLRTWHPSAVREQADRPYFIRSRDSA